MKSTSLKENMSRNLVTLSWDASIESASLRMEGLNIRHLPVTDFDGTVIGILSDRDVKRAMNPDRPGFASGALVRDFMNWPVIKVKEERPLRTVVSAMLEEKISAVLVTGTNDQLVGIVTTEDMLMLLASLLDPEKKSMAQFAYSPLIGELLREAQAAGI